MLYAAAELIAGMVESNDSLPPGLCVPGLCRVCERLAATVTCGLTVSDISVY